MEELSQQAPAFAPPPPPPMPNYAPPAPIQQMAAPAASYEQESSAASSLKDTNWVAILVAACLVAMSIATIYYFGNTKKYHKRNANNFQNQISEAKAEIEDIKNEIENQNFLEQQEEKPITIW